MLSTWLMKGLVVVYAIIMFAALLEWFNTKDVTKAWLALYWLSAIGLMISVLGMSLLKGGR